MSHAEDNSSESIYKILWVQDEYEGPMNGLVKHHQDVLWFSRLNTAQIVPSTDLSSTSFRDDVTNDKRTYALYRLSGDDMEAVIKNHNDYCEETGAPLAHGDPFRIKRRVQTTKMEPETIQSLVSKGEDSFEAEPRTLICLKKYNYKVIPGEITGELVTTIKESEFSNYSVPRRCEHI